MMSRKLRFGMVGGGRGAFIGAVHRIAAQLDGQAELVCGAFSSDAQRSRSSGADLFLDPSRVYDTYEAMAAAEAAMPAEKRIDFVVIVTPNDQHYAIASLFLTHAFNVVCEKPVTVTLQEAHALRELVAKTGKIFVVTHNYAGNAMVKQARDLVRQGRLGTLRKVVVEYSQGWLATQLEAAGQKQATWRTDPARSGIAGAIGDIGTHAAHLARYITGLEIQSLCADLTAFVQNRRVDDDGNVLLRFKGGAKGVLHCSQVGVGESNNLNIRIYGEKGALEWRQERPDELIVNFADAPRAVLRRGEAHNEPAAQRATRLPAGHPEGYLEAFANVYREAFRAIAAEVAGATPPPDLDFPTIDDGVAGMQFIEAAVRSSTLGSSWVELEPR